MAQFIKARQQSFSVRYKKIKFQHYLLKELAYRFENKKLRDCVGGALKINPCIH